jgi:MSHA pilin protein MshC
MRARQPTRSHGFTLTELIIVIVLMGTISAIAVSRMVTSKGFASRGFYDEAQGVVRFAQKTAIAWRRPIYVCVAADKVSAISNSDCNAPVVVPNPVNPANSLQTQPAPSGVTLTPVGSFSFDGIGRPTPTYTITVNSTNADDPVRKIIVAAETGYVYH